MSISCTATRWSAAIRREAIATTDYGGPVVAMVAAGNRAGTQFHVEKSQEVGIRILGQFPALDALTHGRRPHRSPPGRSCLVERVTEFTDDDLHALCEATDAAIIDGGGFGWVNPPGPPRAGDATSAACCWCRSASCSSPGWTACIVGSAHLVRPPRNNEAQAFAAHLMHAFIAPYARGHGLARMLTAAGGGAARANSATTC